MDTTCTCGGADSGVTPGDSASKPAALAARLYLGALVGLLLALGLSRIVWLEMRVRTELVVPVCALVLAVSGYRRGWRPSPWMVLGAQIVVAACFLAAGGFDPASLAVLPAALARDGLGLSGVSLSAMNWLMPAMVVLGNLICLKGRGGRTK